MKTKFYSANLFVAIGLIVCLAQHSYAQNTYPWARTGNVGIATTSPNPSAILDLDTTGMGFLMPRMTQVQRDAISFPAKGLMIYQTNNTPGFYYYSGTAWAAIAPKAPNKSLSNLTAPTAVNVDLLPGIDNSTSLGSNTLKWKDLNLYNLNFSNGTTQSTAFVPYTAGTGINITSGSVITNTAPDQLVSLAGTGGITISGTYPSFTINSASGSGGWLLTGNSGTNPATNFLGTTDAQPLVFKVNNQKAGLIDYAASKANSSFGYQSLNSNTGNNNTANGYQSLFSNTTAIQNTASGAYSLKSNTTGSYNTANGVNALFSNTTGYGNTAAGISALNNNTSGFYNTATGNVALYNNSTGNYNAANGVYALYSNTTGSNNTANGYDALYSNTTGIFNTASGSDALYSNTTGNKNTAYGTEALLSDTTGIENTAIGVEALKSNTNAIDNTATGYHSLYSNTISGHNTANGAYTLKSNTTGGRLTADGNNALYSNTIGDDNTANGYNALYSNTTGVSNSAFGSFSLYDNITGYENTANGIDALISNTNAVGNTGIGAYAGDNFNNGNWCTFIGWFTAANAAGYFNSTALGDNTVITASNQVRIGSGVSSIGGPVSWSTVSDGRFKKNIKENVPGLEFIKSLKPVTYNLDVTGLNAYQHKDMSELSKDGKSLSPTDDRTKIFAEQEKINYSGFIAQDVEKAAKEMGYDFSGVDAPKNDKDIYGLRYSDFVVPLVKAVQELSKQNDSLKETVSNQQKINADLQKQFNDLKTLVLSIQQCSPCSVSGATAQAYNTTINDAAKLEQNAPNPFNNNTVIKYYVPSNLTNAQLLITDVSGHVLKSIVISNKGAGQIVVSAGTLSSGSYFYSLIIDGKKVDTKQMELLK